MRSCKEHQYECRSTGSVGSVGAKIRHGQGVNMPPERDRGILEELNRNKETVIRLADKLQRRRGEVLINIACCILLSRSTIPSLR